METQLESSSSSLLVSNSWKVNPNIPVKIEPDKLTSPIEVKYLRTQRQKDQMNSEVNAGEINPNFQQLPLPPLQLRLTPSSANLLTLSQLLSQCDVNCSLCDEYILQLSQHIINTHGQSQGQGQGTGQTVQSSVINFNNVNLNIQNGLQEETESYQNLKSEFEEVYSVNSVDLDDCNPEHSDNRNWNVETAQEFDPVNFKTKIEVVETAIFDNIDPYLNNCTQGHNIGNPIGPYFTDSGSNRDSECDTDYEPKLKRRKDIKPKPSPRKSDKDSEKSTGTTVKLISLNCEICNARFHHVNTLNSHLRTVHMDVTLPAFACSYCDEKFLCERTMISHVRRVHPGIEEENLPRRSRRRV